MGASRAILNLSQGCSVREHVECWMAFRRHLLFIQLIIKVAKAMGSLYSPGLYIVGIKGQVTFVLASSEVKLLAEFFLFCQQE